MILGTACVSYTHDLSDAPAGRLNVHVYKNGAQSETLNTHTVGSKTTSKAQFSAGSSDLTEVSKIFVYVDTVSKSKIICAWSCQPSIAIWAP